MSWAGREEKWRGGGIKIQVSVGDGREKVPKTLHD